MARSQLSIRSTSHLALLLDFDERRLEHLASTISHHVSPIELPKKSKGTRRIYRPSSELKIVQRRICRRLLQEIELPDTLHGSVPGRSPRTNAQPHIGKPIVVCMDIRDFYPSIHYTRVYRLFCSLDCTPDVARLLTKLTTYEGHLAQGFPTSSAIANLVLAEEIVPRLAKLCSDHGLTFSLYQDDLTVSGGHCACDLINLLSRIFSQCGLSINQGKTNILPRNVRQEVTGWVVNEKPNVSRDEYRALRVLLHKCKVQGIDHVADRPVSRFRSHVRGRIQRVLEVNPERGKRFLDEFENL